MARPDPWAWIRTVARQWHPVVTFMGALLALLISIGAFMVTAAGTVWTWFHSGADISAYAGQWSAIGQPDALTAESVALDDTTSVVIGSTRYRIDPNSEQVRRIARRMSANPNDPISYITLTPSSAAVLLYGMVAREFASRNTPAPRLAAPASPAGPSGHVPVFPLPGVDQPSAAFLDSLGTLHPVHYKLLHTVLPANIELHTPAIATTIPVVVSSNGGRGGLVADVRVAWQLVRTESAESNGEDEWLEGSGYVSGLQSGAVGIDVDGQTRALPVPFQVNSEESFICYATVQPVSLDSLMRSVGRQSDALWENRLFAKVWIAIDQIDGKQIRTTESWGMFSIAPQGSVIRGTGGVVRELWEQDPALQLTPYLFGRLK